MSSSPCFMVGRLYILTELVDAMHIVERAVPEADQVVDQYTFRKITAVQD